MQSGHLLRIAALTALLASGCGVGDQVNSLSVAPPAPTPQTLATSTDAASPTPTPEPVTEPAPTSTNPPPAPPIRPKPADPVRLPPPKLSPYRYVFPVKDCPVTYTKRLLVLPKTTVWAQRGCSFVAPIGGRVHEVNTRDRWRPKVDHGATREGRYVTIIGDDGVRYLGGHLATVTRGLKPGMRVSAGQVLGTIGDSGDARGKGTNLYFAISWETAKKYWYVRRGMVGPWNYLDAWRNGNSTYSPAPVVIAVKRRLGATPRCKTLCRSQPAPKPADPRTPVPADPLDDRVTRLL
ncbi:M23 family metallopeptidase [Rhizohabitans arisaemae]|uniref:M23 family metallopeptidase n=1 Tax=Rhizohabitans arisaemae TaxID=2720610 RepID=UPI0024B06688|nr:M23 family metallopeptidase [Rhizohabitans arisaemae]